MKTVIFLRTMFETTFTQTITNTVTVDPVFTYGGYTLAKATIRIPAQVYIVALKGLTPCQVLHRGDATVAIHDGKVITHGGFTLSTFDIHGSSFGWANIDDQPIVANTVPAEGTLHLTDELFIVSQHTITRNLQPFYETKWDITSCEVSPTEVKLTITNPDYKKELAEYQTNKLNRDYIDTIIYRIQRHLRSYMDRYPDPSPSQIKRNVTPKNNRIEELQAELKAMPELLQPIQHKEECIPL